MSETPLRPTLDDLPATIPVFPLSGALLLPEGRLPLNIFEPRYLAMVQDALGTDRLIGMIQPLPSAAEEKKPALFETGCAGKITSFTETEDGRYLITLTGMIRFRVEQEIPSLRGYRRVVADWAGYSKDLHCADDCALDRTRLVTALRTYFDQNGIVADWDAIDGATDPQLITTLSMVCPFSPTEKQALLEATSLTERGTTMITLLEMAGFNAGSDDGPRH